MRSSGRLGDGWKLSLPIFPGGLVSRLSISKAAPISQVQDREPGGSLPAWRTGRTGSPGALLPGLHPQAGRPGPETSAKRGEAAWPWGEELGSAQFSQARSERIRGRVRETLGRAAHIPKVGMIPISSSLYSAGWGPRDVRRGM